jgi:hypothetical protein
MERRKAIVPRFSLAVLIGLITALASADSALAQQAGTASAISDKHNYVVGRDAAIAISGKLPVACAGTTVQVALFTRGPASAVNEVDDLIPPAGTTVTANGSFAASLGLPTRLPLGPRTTFAGVRGGCLAAPVVSVSGPVLLSVLDPVENNGFAGTFVIPATVLNRTENIAGGGTLGAALGSVAVFAGGTKCTQVDVSKGVALDSEGNAHLHVGGPGQPPACSRDGAAISFVTPRDRPFSKRGL